jgi:hypothetical protein
MNYILLNGKFKDADGTIGLCGESRFVGGFGELLELAAKDRAIFVRPACIWLLLSMKLPE